MCGLYVGVVYGGNPLHLWYRCVVYMWVWSIGVTSYICGIDVWFICGCGLWGYLLHLWYRCVVYMWVWSIGVTSYICGIDVWFICGCGLWG